MIKWTKILPAAAFGLARTRGGRIPAAIAELPDEMLERSAERAMDMAVISVNSVVYEMFGFAAKHVVYERLVAPAARPARPRPKPGEGLFRRKRGGKKPRRA